MLPVTTKLAPWWHLPCYDNLCCHQWRQSWHHDDLLLSVSEWNSRSGKLTISILGCSTVSTCTTWGSATCMQMLPDWETVYIPPWSHDYGVPFITSKPLTQMWPHRHTFCIYMRQCMCVELFHQWIMSSLSKSCKICVALAWKIIIISCHNFAHDTTAQLSCHVQNCDMIGLIDFNIDVNEFSRDFKQWAHKLFVKWLLGLSPSGNTCQHVVDWCHNYVINSLAPGKSNCDFTDMVFLYMVLIDNKRINFKCTEMWVRGFYWWSVNNRSAGTHKSRNNIISLWHLVMAW